MRAPGAFSIIAAATLGVAAYVWWRNSQANADTDDTGDDDTDPAGFSVSGLFSGVISSVNNQLTSVSSAVANPNVQAFLVVIRVGEGTSGADGYSMLFGGGHFTGFAAHPGGTVTAGGYTSSAAGAYQFLSSTWAQLQAQYGLPDFSPASQDIGAVALIKQQGALADVINGNFAAAVKKCATIWASLPGSPYGQPTRTLAQAQQTFADNGGVETDGVSA